MQKKSVAPRRLQPKDTTVDRVVLWLGGFFFIGIIVGVLCAKSISEQTIDELSQYFTGYITLAQTQTQQVLWVMIGLYVRYVALAFFMGFVSIGVVLLPLLTVVYGALLSFSVCALVATFGDAGVWLALALLGIRTLVGIPCYLWVARQAHGVAYGLTLLCLGIKKGTNPVYTAKQYMGFGLCLVILLVGVWLEYSLGARLLTLAYRG